MPGRLPGTTRSPGRRDVATLWHPEVEDPGSAPELAPRRRSNVRLRTDDELPRPMVAVQRPRKPEVVQTAGGRYSYPPIPEQRYPLAIATLSGIKHEVGVLQDMSWRRPAQIDARLSARDHHPLEHEGGATGANGLVRGDLASRRIDRHAEAHGQRFVNHDYPGAHGSRISTLLDRRPRAVPFARHCSRLRVAQLLD